MITGFLIVRHGALWVSEDGRKFSWDEEDGNDVFRDFDTNEAYDFLNRISDDVVRIVKRK